MFDEPRGHSHHQAQATAEGALLPSEGEQYPRMSHPEASVSSSSSTPSLTTSEEAAVTVLRHLDRKWASYVLAAVQPLGFTNPLNALSSHHSPSTSLASSSSAHHRRASQDVPSVPVASSHAGALATQSQAMATMPSAVLPQLFPFLTHGFPQQTSSLDSGSAVLGEGVGGGLVASIFNPPSRMQQEQGPSLGQTSPTPHYNPPTSVNPNPVVASVASASQARAVHGRSEQHTQHNIHSLQEHSPTPTKAQSQAHRGTNVAGTAVPHAPHHHGRRSVDDLMSGGSGVPSPHQHTHQELASHHHPHQHSSAGGQHSSSMTLHHTNRTQTTTTAMEAWIRGVLHSTQQHDTPPHNINAQQQTQQHVGSASLMDVPQHGGSSRGTQQHHAFIQQGTQRQQLAVHASLPPHPSPFSPSASSLMPQQWCSSSVVVGATR